MNVDQMALDARVARHAALADPVRLRIVDLLSLGDASPVELQAVLGVPSNLLAHHLAALEGAGVVTRWGSHADRRRTYVHLVAGVLDGLAPDAVLSARRVVFVCTGNSARSQLAAAIWRAASPIPAASAGTHPADVIHPGAVAAAGRHGLTLTAPAPRALVDVVRDDDLVVTVCDIAHEEIRSAGRLHWSVADPALAGTDEAFDATVEDLTRRIDNLARHTTAA